MAKKNPQTTKALTVIDRKPDMASIANLLDGNVELAEFFMKWLTNGKNATKAYMEMHPNCDYHSARVLGSVTLAKINIPIVLEALGMGVSRYMDQLNEGLNAEKKAILRKYDKQGKITQEIDLSQPDHKTRRLYHEPLGKMLDLEKDKAQLQVNQFNFSNLSTTIKSDRESRGL